MRIKPQNAVDVLLGETLDDVDLVKHLESFRKRRARGMGPVMDDRLDLYLRLVGLELAAQHVDVGAEFVERVGAAVCRDESLAALHEINETLRVREGKITRRVAEDIAVVVLDLVQRQL